MIHCCRDCPDRHIGCHATCESYIRQKAEYEENKNRIRKIKEKESQFRMLRNDQIEKMRKKGKL